MQQYRICIYSSGGKHDHFIYLSSAFWHHVRRKAERFLFSMIPRHLHAILWEPEKVWGV